MKRLFLIELLEQYRPLFSEEVLYKNIRLLWVGKDDKELPTNNWSVVRMFNKWIG